MAKSSSWANSLLKAIFNNVGDASSVLGTGTLNNLYFALHTSDPTAAGNQTTNEAAYTGYSRVAVARTTSGFNVSGNSVNLVSNVTFPSCSANPGNPVTYFSIGTAASGAGSILYSGTLTPSVSMAVGTTPSITTAANLVVEN